jgi:hypothetical protein
MGRLVDLHPHLMTALLTMLFRFEVLGLLA